MNVSDVFEYNQHFVAMMNIINSARLNLPESGHKHHIIPRCWFRMNNLPVDNSKDNLVLLSVDDHYKVHVLASKCCVNSLMRSKMGMACHRLNSKSRVPYHLSEETKKKISEARKGKPGPWRGKHITEEMKKKLSEANKGKPCPRTIVEFNKSCKGAHWKLVNGRRQWYGLQ